MSSKNYEANDYIHNLDVLVISYYLHVSYPARSGCRGKSMWRIHIYRIPKIVWHIWILEHYSDALRSSFNLEIVHIMNLVRNKNALWSWWSSVLAFFSLIVGGHVGSISFSITKLLKLIVLFLLKIGRGLHYACWIMLWEVWSLDIIYLKICGDSSDTNPGHYQQDHVFLGIHVVCLNIV